MDERRDGEAVPVGQDFVVEPRARAAIASRQELATQNRKAMPFLDGRRGRLQAVQNHDRTTMVLVRPIAFGSHVVAAGKECGVLLPERVLDLITGPDVELTLDAF